MLSPIVFSSIIVGICVIEVSLFSQSKLSIINFFFFFFYGLLPSLFSFLAPLWNQQLKEVWLHLILLILFSVKMCNHLFLFTKIKNSIQSKKQKFQKFENLSSLIKSKQISPLHCCRLSNTR